MLRILVTGANGQLGSELRSLAPAYGHFGFTFIDLAELDLTDEAAVERYFESDAFDVVINCAAYTAVDKAEEDPLSAMKLNRDAVRYLSSQCKAADTYLIQISTDYVFDGRGNRPYREDDRTNPQSVYGLSKLAGEEAMMTCLSKGMIIRTSWLYSPYGNNFVKTIYNKAKEKGHLRVVSDQFGNPTYARDLARTILDILPKALSDNELHILHYSNEGNCSWYDFAGEIVRIAGIPCTIEPIPTSEYPLPAPRPVYSALDKSRIKTNFGVEIPVWKDGLKRCMKEMIPDSRFRIPDSEFRMPD
jgi:dTDP-4-dehydrorhamnose reductase